MHSSMSIIDTAAMKTTRLNITLPDEIIARLSSIPNKSKYIAAALREKIEREKKEALDALLCEGYQATREEDLEINAEWEAATLENWD